MKKSAILPLLFLICIIVCGCASRSGINNQYAGSENDVADDCMQQILDAIALQDKDALKNLFSSDALSRMDHDLLDQQMDRLFTCLSQEVTEFDGFLSTATSNHEGTHNHQIRGFYTIEDAVGTHHICFTLRDYDKENEDAVGLSLIVYVSDAAFQSEDFVWQYHRDPGIYIDE